MRTKELLLLLFLLFFYAESVFSDTISDEINSNWKLYLQDLKYLDSDLDSAYQLSSKHLVQSVNLKDTSAQVLCLISMADIQKNIGNYSKAYDHIWEAQLLAESSRDTIHLAECHYMLGMLYGIFNKEEEAVEHMKQALILRKKLQKRSILKERELISNYFSIAVRYSRSKNFKQANTYLDTCLVMVKKYDIAPYYILAERAYIAINENELVKAENILRKITPYFEDKQIRFEVMIYSFWGQLKVKQSLWNDAIFYYKKCLAVMQESNMHTDIKSEVLHELSKVYAQKNMQGKAYSYLSEAKKIDDNLFNARNNGELLEVKNSYREVMRQKNDEITHQQDLLKERQQQNFRLKVFLGLILFALAISVLLVKNWYQRKGLIENQYRAELKIKLEKEKHEEVMEVKNKEITSYTLQLIDKERVVDNLLCELEKHLDEASYRGIRNTTKDFNKNLWNEFNERFTKVNSGFYKKLKNSYPSLSPTDLKHCALIKLNFNGKEMAQLLNISLPSVHIARHRIRKKFKLNRQDNLAKFIGEI
ncbi:tetratricopeptide repeat protein [Labilibaculum antarcticum]|uniref:HTH luxR-type domain-containing protein n=1 Tax=Labilibaculum antarcticum TaxID=1717717 RepID=A0A1Y1CKA3_9BACT|nr:hypothetical protein [Labilibaculum antarcticum]BAX80819.1 hypothetical protein ALGA_2497 [Labilibaculum antarcticum]